MKHFKKMIALVIAMVMIVGTMNLAAFAAGEDGLNTDAKITITGLTQGDTVNLYKVLEWTDGTGWTLTSGFTGLNTAGINALIANTPDTQLSADDLAAIATKAASASASKVDSEKLIGADGEYSYTANEVGKAGLYVALVTAAKAGTVYNPIVISADFSSDNATNTIPASSAINGTSVAKKKEITVDKTEPKITNDVGDTYSYTVETTIPVYSSAFTNQFFTVSDSLSDYLDLDQDSIKINGDTVEDWFNSLELPDVTLSDDILKVTKAAHSFTIEFKHGLVSKLAAATPITITYDAKLNVPVDKLTNVKEEENDISVTFPNNPNDLTGKKVTALKDGTREYTFSIDGSLFGNSDWQTAELVKVGLDKNNSPIEAVINVSNGSKHAALKDATFGLFTTEAAANAYTKDGSEITTSEAAANAGLYHNSVFNGIVKTDANGLMEMNGLDVGTYYLKELDAPAGYIKDGNVHTIEITADINGDGKAIDPQTGEEVAATETGEKITEWYTVDETGKVTWHDEEVTGGIKYEYYVPVLKSYTITIDGKKSSTYTMTLDGPSVSSVTPAESSTDIVNTKGVELPSTGGIGTTIFYIIGAVLVLGAGILLVTRRRMNAD